MTTGPEPTTQLHPTPRPAYLQGLSGTTDPPGGLLEMAVTRGEEQHRMRFHLRRFRFNEPGDYLFTTGGGTTVHTFHDYSYTAPPASIGGGNEQSVACTISNLRDIISSFYNEDWTISEARLFGYVPDSQYVATNPTREHAYPYRMQELVMPRDDVGVVHGVNPNASPNGASMLEMQFHTEPVVDSNGNVLKNRGRAKVVLLNNAVFDAGQVPLLVEGDPTVDRGNNPIAFAIAYLGSQAGENFNSTAIVAHNGQPLAPRAKVIFRMYQRWMRKLNRNALPGTL